jgi:hypothetical protein
MTTMAWDKKMEISMAVNAVLYELFHFSVVSEYIAVVCDFYSSANWYGWTNERHEGKEITRGLYEVWVHFCRN